MCLKGRFAIKILVKGTWDSKHLFSIDITFGTRVGPRILDGKVKPQ